MKKHVFGRQLGRDVNERRALFRNLMSELVLHERIQTTEQKAKSIKGNVEKLVTKAKKKGLSARMLVSPELTSAATQKLLLDIAPRFENRNGGYTRIIRLERRLSDNASMVLLEWVEKGKALSVAGDTKKSSKKTTKGIDEVMADVSYGKDESKTKKATTKKTEAKKKGTSREARSGSAREKTK